MATKDTDYCFKSIFHKVVFPFDTTLVIPVNAQALFEIANNSGRNLKLRPEIRLSFHLIFYSCNGTFFHLIDSSFFGQLHFHQFII